MVAHGRRTSSACVQPCVAMRQGPLNVRFEAAESEQSKKKKKGGEIAAEGFNVRLCEEFAGLVQECFESDITRQWFLLLV